MISLKYNRKILILVEVFETISILVNFFLEKLDLGIFFKNVDFGQICQKNRFGSIFSKSLILVNIFEHLDFGQNFPKC